ncbi:MAG: hypothetical protein JWQ21_2272 [Herminiimonas sp.]|nr:hypothetical protein [Herminiimonas sp.]
MKSQIGKKLAHAVGVLAFSLTASAGAMRIDGVGAFEPIAASGVTPTVVAGTLNIALPEGRKLIITPWPSFLPQRFAAQTVNAARQMHPAGPTDRLSLTRDSEKKPWLLAEQAAGRASRVVGEWRMRLADGEWSISDGKTERKLGDGARPARPVNIANGPDRWCVYLLESSLPRPQPGIAMEQEPRIDWAALRLEPRQKRCPAQR